MWPSFSSLVRLQNRVIFFISCPMFVSCVERQARVFAFGRNQRKEGKLNNNKKRWFGRRILFRSPFMVVPIFFTTETTKVWNWMNTDREPGRRRDRWPHEKCFELRIGHSVDECGAVNASIEFSLLTSYRVLHVGVRASESKSFNHILFGRWTHDADADAHAFAYLT